MYSFSQAVDSVAMAQSHSFDYMVLNINLSENEKKKKNRIKKKRREQLLHISYPPVLRRVRVINLPTDPAML